MVTGVTEQIHTGFLGDHTDGCSVQRRLPGCWGRSEETRWGTTTTVQGTEITEDWTRRAQKWTGRGKETSAYQTCKQVLGWDFRLLLARV